MTITRGIEQLSKAMCSFQFLLHQSLENCMSSNKMNKKEETFLLHHARIAWNITYTTSDYEFWCQSIPFAPILKTHDTKSMMQSLPILKPHKTKEFVSFISKIANLAYFHGRQYESNQRTLKTLYGSSTLGSATIQISSFCSIDKKGYS